MDSYDDANELYHWVWDKSKIKYIAKVPMGKGKFRYFYSQKEYQAYLNNKKTTESIKTKAQSIVDLFQKIQTFSKKTISSGKDYVEKKFKYIAKVSTGNTFRYFYSQKEYDSYLATLNANSEVNEESDKMDAYNKLVDSAVAFSKEPNPKTFDELKKKESVGSNDEDQASINPYYGTKLSPFTDNCAYCSAAYELRRRGYDVQASPIILYDNPIIEGEKSERNTVKECLSWYKDVDYVPTREIIADHNIEAKVQNFMAGLGLQKPKYSYEEYGLTSSEYSDMLEDSIKKNGEGSRGSLSIAWKNGGGHSVAWEIENGEVVIRDCQTNKKYTVNELAEYSSEISYYRTDNCELADEILKTVKNCNG